MAKSPKRVRTLSLPMVSEQGKLFAKSMAEITVIVPEGDGAVHKSPADVTAAELLEQANRIASLDDFAERRAAIFQILNSSVGVIGSARRLARDHLQLASQLDAFQGDLARYAEWVQRGAPPTGQN